jgi:hypothetical protein
MTAWESATLDTLLIARVIEPLYFSDSQLWPDAVYPYRVEFDSVVREENLPANDIRPDALLAVRESVIRQGRADRRRTRQ